MMVTVQPNRDQAIPDAAITTDLIVGFPGETEDDFGKLMKLMADVGFDNSFSFIFSPRPGTPAAALKDETPHEVKLRRLQQVQGTIDTNMRRISAQMVGTTQRVLVESVSKRDNSDLMGRTECNRAVNFAGHPRLIGQFVDVRITEARSYSLRAKIKLPELEVSLCPSD